MGVITCVRSLRLDGRGNTWEVAHLGLVVFGAWGCAVDPAGVHCMPLARAEGVHMEMSIDSASERLRSTERRQWKDARQDNPSCSRRGRSLRDDEYDGSAVMERRPMRRVLEATGKSLCVLMLGGLAVCSLPGCGSSYQGQTDIPPKPVRAAARDAGGGRRGGRAILLHARAERHPSRAAGWEDLAAAHRRGVGGRKVARGAAVGTPGPVSISLEGAGCGGNRSVLLSPPRLRRRRSPQARGGPHARTPDRTGRDHGGGRVPAAHGRGRQRGHPPPPGQRRRLDTASI